MRPGQITPNDFELAILERIASQDPSLVVAQELHVLSREFTGVGSFTSFRRDEGSSGSLQRKVSLDALIEMPGVPNGMGAILFCKGNEPSCLEVFTYEGFWDGVYEGFGFDVPA